MGEKKRKIQGKKYRINKFVVFCLCFANGLKDNRCRFGKIVNQSVAMGAPVQQPNSSCRSNLMPFHRICGINADFF